MACTGCNNCNCSSCVSTGCSSTLNSDCVVYNKGVLSYESTDTVANSTRTLTELLEDLESLDCCSRPSVIETEDFEITEDHINKLILLKADFDETSGGTMTLNIELPDDIAFAGKTLIFKDISGTGTGGRVVEWIFSDDIQYQWSPSTASSDEYTILSELSNDNKVLYLTFVKISSTSYAWLVV